MVSEEESSMNVHDIPGNDNDIEKNIQNLIPKQKYYSSLDSSIRNLSVAVNEKLQAKKEKQFYFRRQWIIYTPVATIATFAFFYFTFFFNSQVKDSYSVPKGISSTSMPLSEPTTGSAQEFEAIIDDEVHTLLNEYTYQDDALFLFDDMTSSDLQTAVDELVEVL